MRIPLPLRWTALVGLLLFAAPAFLAPAHAELIESRDLNFEFEIPHGWSRLPDDPGWKQLGIVAGAIRKLEKLKDGKPAKGVGGLVHLGMEDMPEGKTLDDMAADNGVRGFLLKRFGDDPSSWPEVEVASDEDPDTGLPYRILKVDGKGTNLAGRTSPVRAVLVLTAAKKKLYKLRMYGWHTEFDEEGIKGDLDVIEMNFIIIDPKDDPKGESEGERPPDSDEPEEDPDAVGDREEVVVSKDELVGWKITKPKGIKSFDWDKDAQPDAVAWYQDNTQYGSYQIILYVIRRGRQRDGVAVPDMKLKEWGYDKWWPRYDKSHPDGPIRIWKFPKRPKKYLVLPDITTEKELFKEPKKRPKKPEKIDGSHMIKKWKNAEKFKGARLGEEKLIEAYRAVLGGNRQRSGREMVMRYMWGTPRLTCMLIVSFSRQGYEKWGKDVQKLLDGIEMTGRPKRRPNK